MKLDENKKNSKLRLKRLNEENNSNKLKKFKIPKSKKDSKLSLERLNKEKKPNRLKKFNITNSKKTFNFNNSLKHIKNVIYYISNKIEGLMVVNNDKDKNNILDKKTNSNKKNILLDRNNRNYINNNNFNMDNIRRNTFNKKDSGRNNFHKTEIHDFSNKIEENFLDEYYRRIEPSEESLIPENFHKSLDNKYNNINNINNNNNLKKLNNKRNNRQNNSNPNSNHNNTKNKRNNPIKKRNNNNYFNFDNSEDIDSFLNESDDFDKYFPKGIPKSESLANESRDFKEKTPQSISSGPLSDKFGNLNKSKEDGIEGLDFKNILKLDKNLFKKFKTSITSNSDSKTVFGAAIFGLILIVLLFSTYYFLFFQPYQNDLSTAKTNKLNELNSLFKGPLALDPNVLTLSSEIELSTSSQEVNAINIIRPATAAWRDYQSKQINKTKDDFNRVMVTYETSSSENTASGSTIVVNNQTSKGGMVYAEPVNVLNNKNVIMDVNDAQSFINENDGTVLSNIVLKKPDTVAVPILITRLQAAAGLISIGSIVDIYFLSDSNSQPMYANNETSENNDSNQSQQSSNSQSSSNAIVKSPDISGSTVLAIMRSKDSGVINANYIKSQTKINGNNTNQVENSESFSTDNEEMIRASISGGFDEEHISSLLNSYGLKLSDYERQANIAELEVQYLLLIEVPRVDVPYVITNMENLILTIPTSDAPNWMVTELKTTYLKTSANG